MSTQFWAPPYRTDFAIARGGGGGGGTQSSISQVTLPGWVDEASQSSYSQAAQAADRPYQANPAQQVAPLTPDQQAAYAQIRALQGTTAPAYSQAEGVSSGLLSQAAPITTDQVNASTGALMNPYQEAVVAPTVAQMRQDLAQQKAQIGSQASNVGAFGGSRLGIEQGTAEGQEAIGEGKLVGGLLQSGYDTAQGRALGIAQANQNLGAQQISLLPQLATAQAGETAKETGLLSAAGQQEQQQAQAQADLAAQQWSDEWNYPLLQAAIKQGALSSSPYGTTTYTQGTAKPGGGNLAGNIIGGIGAAAGLLALV